MYIDSLLAAVWEIRGMIPQANSIHPPLHFYLCKRLVPWLACFSYSYNFQPPFNKADVIYANRCFDLLLSSLIASTLWSEAILDLVILAIAL